MTSPSAAAGLIGLLDTFALTSEDAVRQRVVDSAAENYEAEIVAIVSAGRVTHATGIGGSEDLERAVAALAASAASTTSSTKTGSDEADVVLPGLGGAHVAALPIGENDPCRFMLIRTTGPFDPAELRGCRAMIRIMRLASRSIDAFDEQVRVSQRLAEEVELNRKLADELQRRHTDFMARMLDIQGLLTNSTGPVLESIVRQTEELMGSDIVMLQLLRPDGKLELALHSGNAPAVCREYLEAVSPEESVGGYAIQRDELVVTNPYSAHERALPELVDAGITATISAPVRRRNEVVGALSVASIWPGREFDREEIETVLLLAGYASVALTDALTLGQRQKALVEAEWQATHDPLTGLANRRLVMDTITERLSAGVEFNVLYIDVDRFKSVNDRFGHVVGDQLIKEVARRITISTRADDLVGRLAGDEFIVVFATRVGHLDASEIAERVREELNGPAEVGDHIVPLSVSIGIASSAGAFSAEDVINAADVAMYQAKSAGRNQVGRYNRGLQTQLRNRAELEERLEIAVSTGFGLHLEYQPIAAIQTGTVVGHEVLLRWVDAVLGSVPPELFVPVAEELGLIARIDDWVLRTALQEAGGGAHGELSVNVSPAWLAGSDLTARVEAMTAACDFPLELLTLEVTKRVAMADNVTAILVSLRSAGVKVLLDDFGTGYSWLAYIRTLAVDGIKIDRGFLEGVETNPRTAAILEAVITLTHRLGAVAVAEGVETEVHAKLLADLGCTQAQGLYFGQPQRAPEGLFAVGARLETAKLEPAMPSAPTRHVTIS